MDDDRSLKAVFDGLAGRSDVDPQELLESLGAHGDLPDELLTAALGSYAETAPAEVAEHLAPFLTAGGDPTGGLELLAAAPVPADLGEVMLGDDVTLNGLDSADQLDNAGRGPDATWPDDATEPDHELSHFGIGDSEPDSGQDMPGDPDLDQAAGISVPEYDATTTGLDQTDETDHDPFLHPEDDLDDLFDPADADDLDE